MAWSSVGASMVSTLKRRSSPGSRSCILLGAVDRGRRDEAHLAPREQRLEQVAHAAAGGALPEQRVDPVHVEERVLRAGLHRRDAPGAGAPRSRRAASRRRRASRSRARGGSASRGSRGTSPAAMRIASAPTMARLADARLADEERVVLLPALEDLQQPAHLDVAADDGVEPLAARALDQVVREARQHVAADGRLPAPPRAARSSAPPCAGASCPGRGRTPAARPPPARGSPARAR